MEAQDLDGDIIKYKIEKRRHLTYKGNPPSAISENGASVASFFNDEERGNGEQGKTRADGSTSGSVSAPLLYNAAATAVESVFKMVQQAKTKVGEEKFPGLFLDEIVSLVMAYIRRLSTRAGDVSVSAFMPIEIFRALFQSIIYIYSNSLQHIISRVFAAYD